VLFRHLFLGLFEKRLCNASALPFSRGFLAGKKAAAMKFLFLVKLFSFRKKGFLLCQLVLTSSSVSFSLRRLHHPQQINFRAISLLKK